MKRFIQTLMLLITYSTAYGQLSGNIEVLTNNFKNSENISSGINLQYLFYIDRRNLPGINVGVNYEFDKVEKLHYASIPVNVQYRKYIIGAHSCCGGIYLEGMGGVKFNQNPKKYERLPYSQKTVAQASAGIGIRTPMSFDLSFKYGGKLIDKKLSPFMGFRLGFTF